MVIIKFNNIKSAKVFQYIFHSRGVPWGPPSVVKALPVTTPVGYTERKKYIKTWERLGY